MKRSVDFRCLLMPKILKPQNVIKFEYGDSGLYFVVTADWHIFFPIHLVADVCPKLTENSENALTDEIHKANLKLNSSGSQEFWKAVVGRPSSRETKADRRVFWGMLIWTEDPLSPAPFLCSPCLFMPVAFLWVLVCRGYITHHSVGCDGDEDHVWDIRKYFLYDSKVTTQQTQLQWMVIHWHAGQAVSLVPSICASGEGLLCDW